jgi:hypothetical protein
MNSLLRIATFAGTLALLAGCGYGKTGPEQTVSVRLYDQAQVPATVLHSAMNETSRLFRAAGIRISWERPSAEAPEDQGTDQTAYVCQRPDERPYLAVRLIRRTPANVYPGALGYSLPLAHSGAHVVIFYDRVEELPQWVNTAAYVILGHAMAHELGHVLLGSTEHALGGLMQARWTSASWRLATAGVLSFEREEVRRMRAGLERLQARRPEAGM